MSQTAARDLSALARPSGGFAMLAMDQREGLRAMLAQHQPGPVPDSALTEFKLQAMRALTPHPVAISLSQPGSGRCFPD